MADAYTTRNRGRKPESGQHNNVWAALANEDLISDRMDEALDGVQAYTLSANKTLTSTNGETDEARMRVQNITSGTGGYTVTIPAVEKWYIVRNASDDDATFSNGSNSVAVKSGNILPIFTNGTDIYQVRCLDYGTDLLKSDATPTLGVHVTNKTYVDAQIAAAAVSPVTMAAGMATWLTSGTSADLRGALTDETGTGAAVFATAPTFTGKPTLPASGTSAASVTVPHGTAPSSPVDGDVWTTTAGLYARINGATIGPFVSVPTWTQIATSTPTGTGTVTFSSIPSTYEDLLIVFEGASHNDGSNQALNIYGSPDNFSTSVSIGGIGAVAASVTAYGAVSVLGYKKASGMAITGLQTLASDNTGNGSYANNIQSWRISAGMNAVRVSWAAGNFDAGTIRLFGK